MGSTYGPLSFIAAVHPPVLKFGQLLDIPGWGVLAHLLVSSSIPDLLSAEPGASLTTSFPLTIYFVMFPLH